MRNERKAAIAQMTLEPQNCGHVSVKDFRKVEEHAKRENQQTGMKVAHPRLIASDFRKR
jgi:hypothetical protein